TSDEAPAELRQKQANPLVQLLPLTALRRKNNSRVRACSRLQRLPPASCALPNARAPRHPAAPKPHAAPRNLPATRPSRGRSPPGRDSCPDHRMKAPDPEERETTAETQT